MAASSNNTISGWAIRYNAPTTIGGSWIEIVAPGAIKSLKDVTLLWSHDDDRPLARTTSGTLQLRDEGRIGLYFSADLDPSNPDAALALSAIGRRDVVGMSYGFLIRKESWSEPKSYDELPIRTVLEMDVSEISAVVWPAFPQSEVHRSSDSMDNASAARRRVVEKMERDQRLRGIR